MTDKATNIIEEAYMSETDEQTIMTDKGSTLIERWIDKNLSSPFWRYYITAFIFVHWKIWLYLFSNMPVHDKIYEIQNITIFFYNIPANSWIANTVQSLIYIVGLPLITFLIVLPILRKFEKETAQFHKRHDKEVRERVKYTKTDLENIRKSEGELQETLKLYRKYVNDLTDIIDIKDLEFDGDKQIILSILSDIEANPDFCKLSGLFASARRPHLPPGNGFVPPEAFSKATKTITYCRKKKYIEIDTPDTFIITEKGKQYIQENKKGLS